MKLELVTPPATEFVSSAIMEAQLGLPSGADAAKITRDILASRILAENYTERSFINQTWRITLDKFPTKTYRNPERCIFLPRGKTQSITTFVYNDQDGNAVTMVADTNYRLENNGDTARLIPILEWPSEIQFGSIQVTYVSGYGTSLPTGYEAITNAVVLWAADLYEMRQMQVNAVTGNSYVNKAFEMLLHPYKIYFDFSINNE